MFMKSVNSSAPRCTASEAPVFNNIFLFHVNFDRRSANSFVHLFWSGDCQVLTFFCQNIAIKIVSNSSKCDANYRCQNLPRNARCQMAAKRSST